MNEKVRLHIEYTKLVREGNLSEADLVLEKIWELKGKHKKNVPVKKETKPKKEKKPEPKEEKKVEKKDSLDDLTKIKGIGKKTVKDIKAQAKDECELIKKLKEGMIALRDDIELKLKKHFKLI